MNIRSLAILRRMHLLVMLFPSLVFAAQPVQTISTVPQWGTYLTPFAADSLWNARPVDPVLGDFVIPKSSYFPSIASGKYSTGMFLSKASDSPMIVKGPPEKNGVWDPDAEATRPHVIIPRWPADTLPASGSDGHADIVDPITGIIHSFWKLKQQDGQWIAMQYAWTRLDGRGWGDPAHYFQGARAAAVPTSAGLVRKHEVNDGQSVYRHALAMSLTYNALSANPTYVYPATSADTTAHTENYGAIPEGALMMLPPTYSSEKIANPALRKIVETLKVFGAYVVDRNVGTPFVIYVENGADFNLHEGGWNNAVAMELDRMRAALRPVISTSGWLDGNGKPMTPQKNFNLLSMRGPWQKQSGPFLGTFDTWEQAVIFSATTTRIVQVNNSSRGMNPVSWAIPKSGNLYRVIANTTGGAKFRLQLRDKAGATLFDSGELGNAESVQFTWPSDDVRVIVYAISGVDQASSVKADLRAAGS